MPAYKNKSMKNRSNKRRMMGGAGAAEHAINTYGGMHDQHASPNGNVIAANTAKMTGGASIPLIGGKKKGGNMLTDVAVPAILLVANHAYKRSSTMRYNNKSRRQSRRNFSRKVRGGNCQAKL